MKTVLLVRLGYVLFACLLSPHAAAGQEPRPPRAEVKLVVQVQFFKGAPLAYEAVPGASWYARFGRVAPAQPRAAADTVRAVDVKTARLDGERVEIRVGVHVGARFHDRLEEVAAYTAALGETVTAVDLERVGVVPFVFKVLRVGPADNAPPALVNKTRSISAAVTDFTPSPLPRAKLTLHNFSAKRVRAVEVRQVYEGRERSTALLAQREGKPLMEPGATYETRVGTTEGRTTPTEFTPESMGGVVIAAVVFEDYTYEGEAATAAGQRAYGEGQRRQLPRAIGLLREARAAEDVEAAAAVSRLRAALDALDEAAPQPSLEAILKGFPGLPQPAQNSLKSTFEIGMHHVKRDLLDGLRQFEGSPGPTAGGSFGAWLKERQERLEAWLARLP